MQEPQFVNSDCGFFITVTYFVLKRIEISKFVRNNIYIWSEKKWIDKLLSEITELEFKDKCNAAELNENNIYPNIWTNQIFDAESNYFNHLTEDFFELKTI